MGITNQKIKIDPPERKWEITQTEFTEKDYEYWKSFGINADILAFYNVLKADNVYYNGDFYSQSEEDDPVYVYHFIKWDRLKIYRPLTKLKRDK